MPIFGAFVIAPANQEIATVGFAHLAMTVVVGGWCNERFTKCPSPPWDNPKFSGFRRAINDRSYGLAEIGNYTKNCPPAFAGGQSAYSGNFVSFPYSARARYRKVTEWARLQMPSTPKVPSPMPLVTSFSTAQLMAASYHRPASTSAKSLEAVASGFSR